jgi:hypothetical protein
MDIYDGADWTEMDIEDLSLRIEAGRSIEDALDRGRSGVSMPCRQR